MRLQRQWKAKHTFLFLKKYVGRCRHPYNLAGFPCYLHYSHTMKESMMFGVHRSGKHNKKRHLLLFVFDISVDLHICGLGFPQLQQTKQHHCLPPFLLIFILFPGSPMRFNAKDLALLARQPSGCFDKEGKLKICKVARDGKLIGKNDLH